MVSKGTAKGLAGTDQLPFTVDTTITDGMGGTAATNWTVTFTYQKDNDGNVTEISAKAEQGK